MDWKTQISVKGILFHSCRHMENRIFLVNEKIRSGKLSYIIVVIFNRLVIIKQSHIILEASQNGGNFFGQRFLSRWHFKLDSVDSVIIVIKHLFNWNIGDISFQFQIVNERASFVCVNHTFKQKSGSKLAVIHFRRNCEENSQRRILLTRWKFKKSFFNFQQIRLNFESQFFSVRSFNCFVLFYFRKCLLDFEFDFMEWQVCHHRYSHHISHIVLVVKF